MSEEHWWQRHLPPSEHPVWRLTQAAVSIIGLLVFAYHGVGGDHAGVMDGPDAAGVGGLALGGRLLWKAWRG